MSDSTAEELAHEAIDGCLDHLESLLAVVREGEESAEHGRWIPHETVFERLNQRLLRLHEGRLTPRAVDDLEADMGRAFGAEDDHSELWTLGIHVSEARREAHSP